MSSDVAGIDASLPCFPDASGWCEWTVEPELGARFLLGFRDDLNPMHPMELTDLTRLFDRSSRPSAAGRAASALSGRGGALVVGRFHHLPWRASPLETAPANRKSASASPTRRRLLTAGVLAAAAGLLAVLTHTGHAPPPLIGEADAAATYVPAPSDIRQWVTPLGATASDHPPLATGGLLLVPCADDRLRVIDAVTGAILDHVPLDAPLTAGPALAGSRILAGFETGSLVSWSAEGLQPQWRSVVGSGNGGAPRTIVVDGDWVWTTSAGAVIALDIADGRERWRRSFTDGTVRHLNVANGVAVGVADGGELFAFNPATGQNRWTQSIGTELVGEPLLGEGHVMVTEGWGRVTAFKLTRGTPQWSTHLSAKAIATACPDGHVFFVATAAPFEDAHPALAALDVRTGDVIWRRDVGTPGHALLELRVDGDMLLTFFADASVHGFDTDTGEPTLIRHLPVAVRAHSLLGAGRLVAANQDTLTAVTWLRPDSTVESSPGPRVSIGADPGGAGM
jgi:hypothetical protein